MTRLSLSTGLLAALLLTTAHSLPPRRPRADSEDFVAVGTNQLATTMLQHYVDVDANIAFSPLGVSALLAILAEGARGATREQLVAALHLPAEREKIRTVYKTVLSRLKDKHTLNHPEFRNWFYVYKNYTVEQCFRDVLEENYLTEVRDVDNPNRSEVMLLAEDSTTETIVIHKPIKIENNGVKVELPEVPTDQPETTSVENELQEVNVDAAKVEYPVKGEGLDPNNLPEGLDPMSQIPITSTMDQFVKDMHVIKPSLNPSQEDSIRTIMVQEAVVMEEALKEHEKNKTLEYIKEREEEMKEALEKDVVDKEQVKVEIEEQIETEKEIQNTLEDKINKQEAVKEVLELNMNKEEEAIETLKEDIAKLEQEKEADAASASVSMENMSNMAAMPDMMNGGQIRVAVVVMNDEEVKQDGAVSENNVPFKEEFVDHDKEEKKGGPAVPFKDVSIFDTIIENSDQNKKNSVEVSTTETADKGVSFVDVSTTDHPQHPHNQHNHDHDHDHNHNHTHTHYLDNNQTYTHTHPHTHDHNHTHIHCHDHDHDHNHTHTHDHDHDHNHNHTHDHDHNHTHTHDHDHDHDHDHMNPSMETPTTPTTPQVTEGEASTPEDEMIAIERKTRSTDEISSSFSGNNLVSRGSAENKVTSMMIAFNALYFKGSWKVPFVAQSKEGVHSFYTSDTEKVPVSMMHAEGSFTIGKIAELDSVAIDLPYEGGRYSLLVLLPNSRSGLKKLIADLAGYSLCDLSKTLTPQRVEVCLPSFEVQTTTKPIRALSKFGVSHVFNKDTADLSGISPTHGLFVQDMSQLVTLNVDLTTSSTNFLTASNEAAMTRGDGEKFVADHPFLYFVHDIVDNIIVVAGKVTNPNTIPDDFQTEV